MRDGFSGSVSVVALGLILGGATGNLLDRAFRGSGWGRGAVIDFIDFQFWPVFNVADAAIVVGVVALSLKMWTEQREVKRSA
jgi:signal peptidase II|tara:strand:- start:151 stop:396 length:246 start_codon:yes stop_codon:yes gene_type:complete